MICAVALITICGVIMGYFLPATYESKLDILINGSGPNNKTTAMNDIDSSLRLIETYKEIMKSDRIAGKVNTTLGGIYSKTALSKNVRIDSGTGSQIITITAVGKSPMASAKLANTYGETAQDEIKSLIGLDNITILKGIVAKTDTKKIKPGLFYFTCLSFLIGTILCMGTLLFLETYFPYLDSRVKVEKRIQIPYLGNIIQTSHVVKSPFRSKSTRMKALSHEDEKFKSLASVIEHRVTKDKLKILMVTSPSSHDGKSYICSNLAKQLAKMDMKVLFIDMHFKDPIGRYLFNLPQRKGLTSAISGHYSLHEIIQKTTIDNLSFIGTGPIPLDHTTFLTMKRLEEMMEEIKTIFDVVLVDVAELSYSDTMNTFPYVDGCLLVVDSRRTLVGKMLNELEMSRELDVNIIGAILNKSSIGLK